jgi:hypothetical protein
MAVSKPGGIWFDDDPEQIRLSDLKLRVKERFLYQYDFGDNWRHQVRLEQKLALDPAKPYPLCIGGSRIVPPEDCGGPPGFLEIEVALKLALWERKRRFLSLMAKLLPEIDQGQGRASLDKHRAELTCLLNQLKAAEFDRQAVNQRLQLYIKGDPEWLEGFI